ncbi:2'-5' RNA ligase family protein [Nocardia altamirensis]|uniref:2'-5' RNA ligase family protein n=1 Tax=Nocardia altamirensis TaxID=472158 RepID=UPI0008402D90|nr:2'-5' RNA ligase family protein [Nocardia altamirensis]
MRNFFDSPHLDWPQLRGSLHVYVLPDPGFCAAVQSVVDAVGAFDGCAAVIPRWQHATVTRIPWWRSEVGEDALERFGAALAAVAADTTAFGIPMQGPWLHEYGVGVAAPEDAQWKRLYTATRDAAVRVFGAERALPAPPPMPHVSLGYGIAERDSASLAQALSTIDTPATLTVDALHFLSVDVDIEGGSFTWDALSSHTVGPS